jgi:hypothetical protein
MTEAEALREFIRQVSIRIERGLLANSEDVRAEIAAHREESRRYFERLDAGSAADRELLDALHRKTDEMIEEGRAGRGALLAILDRLDGRGPSPGMSG